MKVILKPRRGGKTYELIKKASKTNSYIICAHRRQVENVVVMAREMKVSIPFPLTWQEFVDKKYYGKGIDSFMIDDLDLCIQSMTPVEIKAVTMNGREQK